MAEIEDMGAALEAAQHALDLLVEAPSAGDQRQRIEIALKRQPLGQSGDGGLRARRRCRGRSRRCRQGARIWRAASPRRAERRSAARPASRREPWPRSPRSARRTSGRIRPAAARPPRNRRSAPHPRRPRTGGEDIRPKRRRAGRSGARTGPDGDRRRAAPAPGPACRARRSCSSPPSRARRRSRSAPSPSASAVLRRSRVSNTGASRLQSGSSLKLRQALRVADRIEARALAGLEADASGPARRG